jgi:hypothetical protein
MERRMMGQHGGLGAYDGISDAKTLAEPVVTAVVANVAAPGCGMLVAQDKGGYWIDDLANSYFSKIKLLSGVGQTSQFWMRWKGLARPPGADAGEAAS